MVVLLLIAASGCAVIKEQSPLFPEYRERREAEARAAEAREQREHENMERRSLARREELWREAESVRAEPSSFAATDANAWARAHHFLASYASMKIQVATEYVVETYNPTGYAFGYRVIRKPTAEGFSFNVIAMGPSPHNIDRTAERWFEIETLRLRNEAIAARYIRTGELVCERCIAK